MEKQLTFEFMEDLKTIPELLLEAIEFQTKKEADEMFVKLLLNYSK